MLGKNDPWSDVNKTLDAGKIVPFSKSLLTKLES